MINNSNNSGKEEVAVTITTTSPKNNIISYITRNNYNNMIYLLVDKGYIYQKEINLLLSIDSRHYINSLLNNNIIEEFTLDEKRLNDLKLIKNLHDKNILFLTTYQLTDKYKEILKNPFIYDLLVDNTDNKVKKYKDYLIKVYNDKINKIKSKEEETNNKFILKYRIAKEKKECYRTANDCCIIQMVEDNK